jgi:hypothetical protein
MKVSQRELMAAHRKRALLLPSRLSLASREFFSVFQEAKPGSRNRNLSRWVQAAEDLVQVRVFL